MELYLESADRPNESGIANEDVTPGELVYNSGGTVTRAAYSDGDHDGVALYEPEFNAAFDEDDAPIQDYSGSDDDRVTHNGAEDRARVFVRTIEETKSGVTSAPSISHGDVVGIVDSSDADAGDFDGRIVEEGYSNDENDDSASTTFNRSNNNFLAVGEAYRPGYQNNDTVTDFDRPVRVLVWGEPQS
jgi:hypothetical protein